EFFWVSNFVELRKVAGAMATLEGLTRTYFSTPSGETHEAYQFWTGDRWNSEQPRSKRSEFDVSHAHLKGGVLFPDETWRQIVTIEDAVANGWRYTNIGVIRGENTESEFRNLY
ncbi:oxidoreductase, partial [Escherichia coli]|nr:oxidoreductase [Escherichia coli]